MAIHQHACSSLCLVHVNLCNKCQSHLHAIVSLLSLCLDLRRTHLTKHAFKLLLLLLSLCHKNGIACQEEDIDTCDKVFQPHLDATV